jgi:mRNA-degrading endonuclease RelE of RelBE toxin-antitoxin system
MFSFVETRLFTRIVTDYLSDEEYGELQLALATDPELGPVIPGSGGVRKVRWGQPGRGKRGGVRVIYYVKRHDGVIWMLTIYAKNQAATIAPDVILRIKREIDG